LDIYRDPADIAAELHPANKKSFRVKGYLDKYPIVEISLLPMGGGKYMMPLNATIRKGIGKRKGSMVEVTLEQDQNPWKGPAGSLIALNTTLKRSHILMG
jgi:hypothetical protein